MRVKVILVGCGNMGFSMLSSWLRSGVLSAGEVLVVEPNVDLRLRAEGLGVATASSAALVPGAADPELIVLAVKPQSIGEVVAAYHRFGGGDTTFLSVAAGVSFAAFERMLGRTAPIVRCMPNMPASIGKGMTVTISNALVSGKAKELVNRLLSAGGKVEPIDDESLMDVVTAISGSGPAYVFYFIESLAAVAEDSGLSPEFAMLLAKQTIYGAASLAVETRGDPGELRRQVTSPNGTTAAALATLSEGNRLKNLLADAVEAARNRSAELTRPPSRG